MKALALFLIIAPLLAVTDAFAAPSDQSPRDQVLAFEQETCAAYEKNDVAGLEKTLADDYTLTDSHGVITTKGDDVKSARDLDVKYTEFRNYDMRVRIHGDTAIVTGRTVVKGTTREGKAIDIEVQFTDTIVMIGGRWQLEAGHVSRLKS